MPQLNSNLVPTQKNPTLSFFGSRKPPLNPPRSARCRKAHALKSRQSEYYDQQQQQQQRFADSGEPSFSSPGGGVLLNLDENIYIPVTKAEFTVLVSAFNFILPYLIGWHAFASMIRLEDTARPNNNASPRY